MTTKLNPGALKRGNQIHIVHTESSMGWGGQEIRILGESKGLIKRGYAVTILCCPGSHISTHAKKLKIPTVELPIYKKRPSALISLYKWLKRSQQIDVINCHSSTDSWLTAIAVKILRRRLPIVRTRHVSTPVHPTFLNHWLYAKSVKHVITTGESVKDQLVKSNKVPANMITSVPTGIQSASFDCQNDDATTRSLKEKLAIQANDIVIGCIAMMRDWKGHRYLIEAIAQLSDLNIKLLLVGDGEERINLEDQVRNFGLESRLRFVGYQKDVRPFFNIMDIHCLPSYENEGISQALLQACASGLPNIVCPIGGNDEVVIENETGLFVETRSANGIASAIKKLALNPELRVAMGEQARARIKAPFTEESMLNSMESIFTRVTHQNLGSEAR